MIAGTHHIASGPPAFVPGYPEIVDGWLRAHFAREIALAGDQNGS